MPTLFAPPVQTTILENLSTLPQDTLNCPMDHSRFVWQIIYNLLLSHRYRYVFVMVYIFFHLTEAFHYRQATAYSIAKILLEKIIFTWGILLKLHSDKGTRFMGQVFCQLYCLASSTTLSLCLPPSILSAS